MNAMNRAIAIKAGNPMRAAFAALGALAAALVLACCLAPVALANITLNAPTPVTDGATHIEIAKLEAGTHSFVKGATLCIVEKDTGTVVDEWTSDKSIHEISKVLDVNTVYVLKETAAPSGYAKASNVEFRLNEVEGSGIEILSGDDAEQAGDYGINLFDSKVSEKVVHKTRDANRTVAPKTGDETPIWLVAALVGVAIAAIGVLELAKRRARRED